MGAVGLAKDSVHVPKKLVRLRETICLGSPWSAWVILIKVSRGPLPLFTINNIHDCDLNKCFTLKAVLVRHVTVPHHYLSM